MPTPAKTERIQLRVSAEAKAQIVQAASLTQQDVTSFILDAAMARARSVVLETHILKLSLADLEQIEEEMKHADEPSPELIKLFRYVRDDPRFESSL